MADEGTLNEVEAPKSKEEMRDVNHDYVDHNGWCAFCDRSEGWRAHGVKVETEPPKKVPSIDPETGKLTAAPVASPDKKNTPKGEPTSKPPA